MLHIKNFGALDDAQKKILAAFLLKDPVQELWEVGESGGVNLDFRIIKHFSANKPDRPTPIRIRYEVMDNIIFAQGSFGIYYRSLFTISIDREGTLEIKQRQPGKLRLIKEQQIRGISTEEITLRKRLLSNEAFAMQETSFFHSKPMVVVKNKAYMIMRLLPGEELLEIINRRELSIKQRYNLTLALLKALQEQIHDKGWVHRDIKPENILVYREGDDYRIYIIDFGFIKKFNYDDSDEHFGSLIYAAPEYFQVKNKTQKTDVYAMGRVLMFLWGDKNRTGNALNHWLFYLMYQLPECAAEIADILLSMCHENMDMRPSVPEVMLSFNKLENRLAPINKYDFSRYAVPTPATQEKSYCNIV